MRLQLNPFLARFTRLFYFPDTATGGGGEGGGGGGSAATAEPPAGGAAGGDDAGGNADILSFDPGAVDLSSITGKPDSIVEPPPKPGATPPAKKEEKKEDAKPPDGKKPATPPAKPGGEPPIAQLRKELSDSKAALAAAEAKYAETDPRLKKFEADVADAQKQIKERDTKIADYENRIAIADPAVTKELSTLDDKYNKDSDTFFTRVPEIDQRGMNELIRAFDGLKPATDGYKERRAAFEKSVNEKLGGTDEKEHRKLNQTLDFVERTYDFMRDRSTLEQSIRTNAIGLRDKAQIEDYTKRSSDLKLQLAEAKKIPEGLEKTDPHHPKVVLNAFMKSLDEAKQKEFMKGVDDFIDVAINGQRPMTPADYAGMTPEQIAESKAAQAENLKTAKNTLVEVSYNGLLALRLMPSLVKELSRMRAVMEKAGLSEPPDPTGGGKAPGDGGKADEESVETYVAPEIPQL